MNAYICTGFLGHNPVGTADATILADGSTDP